MLEKLFLEQDKTIKSSAFAIDFFVREYLFYLINYFFLNNTIMNLYRLGVRDLENVTSI